MNPIKIIKKTCGLLAKLDNPYFFWYSLHHYLKKDISVKHANKIAEKNRKSYSENEHEIIINTYDGSNQCVHPDTLYFNNRLWLVITPYPYGMEEYENPCIYYGNSITSLNQCFKTPIDIQQKHEIGFHLSDPCIFEFSNNVFCLYRENIRQNGKEKSIIKYKKINESGYLSESKIVIESDTDSLLSPAIYVENNMSSKKIFMLHVNRQKNKSKLICSELNNDLQVISTKEITCVGIPKNFYIWHISISYKKGRKSGLTSEIKYGLFLVRNSINPNDFKLYYAKILNTNTWEITKEIKSPEYIKQNILHPYKSCFIANSNNILFSYVDKKHRYRLTSICIE